MPSDLSRRHFLGTAAGTAAVAMAGPVIAQKGAEPNKKVVVGVMGLSRGKALALDFARQPGVVVKYVCDVDIERAGTAQKQLESDTGQRPEAVVDYREVLDDPQVDALVCAAPNHWHAPATIAACAAGKHVYVEKPCSQNPWEGETMVAAARKHDRAVQMGTQRRSSPAYQEAIAKLHDGVIGKVYLARSWYNNLRTSIGTGKPAEAPENLNYELWQGPAPRVPYYDNRIHYNWHWFWHW
ncbi:MAG: Gfo/Idh/MocA family oxidoreductase, partial [Planctomycetaceae bacterium]|nr:Gfo/Idh/MocA family oxidoreductase [Planctomycetaceae bacterium]